MADFTITVSNRINCFGPAPSTKWNAFNWGAGYWGDGSMDLETSPTKALSESFSISDTLSLQVAFVMSISNQISGTFEASSESLTTGGWNYVFTKPTTDAENRSLASFTAATRGSPTWTSSTVSAPSWSDS